MYAYVSMLWSCAWSLCQDHQRRPFSPVYQWQTGQVPIQNTELCRKTCSEYTSSGYLTCRNIIGFIKQRSTKLLDSNTWVRMLLYHDHFTVSTLHIYLWSIYVAFYHNHKPIRCTILVIRNVGLQNAVWCSPIDVNGHRYNSITDRK